MVLGSERLLVFESGTAAGVIELRMRVFEPDASCVSCARSFSTRDAGVASVRARRGNESERSACWSVSVVSVTAAKRGADVL